MENQRTSVRIALVQDKWQSDQKQHEDSLLNGITQASRQGAQLVILQELTLHRYFGDKEAGDVEVLRLAEDLRTGPTAHFCSRASRENRVFLVASLFERYQSSDSERIRYFNTAVIYSPQGILHGFTRKLHIPSGRGYNEVAFFERGDSDFPVHDLGFLKLAVPTCYDQWFPELARIYALKGAELIVYPTAIGSEPNYPTIDTQAAWQHTIISHGIANGVFMAAVNRVGFEGLIDFYGSSFISAPNGTILAQAPRSDPFVLVADLDFNVMHLWRKIFPLLNQREPSAYSLITQPIRPSQ